MNNAEYAKLKTAIVNQLIGRMSFDKQYADAILAIDYAEKVHSGCRKDGTPEFGHQLNIVGMILTLPDLLRPVECIVAAVLHDVIEDYPDQISTVDSTFPHYATFCRTLNANLYDGTTLYYATIAKCDVCSIVKLVDRIHNMSTLAGVAGAAKMVKYCDTTDQLVQATKKSQRLFATQHNAYQMLRSILRIEMDLMTHLHTTIVQKDIRVNSESKSPVLPDELC